MRSRLAVPGATILAAILVVTIGGGLTACSSDDASSTPSTNPTAATAGSAEFADFCTAYGRLPGSVPEAYVGSAEHVVDIQSLLDAAPDAVAGQLSTFRDFLASGAIDTAADPESNLTENWPVEVQSAIDDIQAFGSANC